MHDGSLCRSAERLGGLCCVRGLVVSWSDVGDEELLNMGTARLLAELSSAQVWDGFIPVLVENGAFAEQQVGAGREPFEVPVRPCVGCVDHRPIAAGEKVFKYGAPIGSATQPIAPGDYVHTRNLKSDYLPTYARGSEYGSQKHQ